MNPQEKEKTNSLLKNHAVIDCHCDSVLKSLKRSDGLSERKQDGHVDAPRMEEGHVSGMFFACWIHPKKTDKGYAAATYERLDELHRLCDGSDAPFEITTSAKQIVQNDDYGKKSIIPCVEGGHSIENSLRHLRNFERLGARYMTLTWMNNNQWADGSGDEHEHGGLTNRGKRIVQEMNRIGMIVDVSHASKATFYDAVRASEKPVLASHSCCRAICDHHRNLSDNQLEAIAETGGVTAICFYPGFLDPLYRRKREEYGKTDSNGDEDGWLKRLPEGKRPEVALDRIVDHVKHAAGVAGIDHVALGSDFDGVVALPNELRDCSDYPKIAHELFVNGFSKEEVRKITGKNILRLMRKS